MNIRRSIILMAILLMAIMAGPAMASQITAVPDAAWATVPTLQTWLDMYIAAQQQFATIPATKTINFIKGSLNGTNCGAADFTVGLATLPTNPNNLADNGFVVAGFEVRHLQPCGGQMASPLIAEGLDSATMMAYWLAHFQGANVPAMSWAPMAYLKRAQNPGAIATQYEFSGPFDIFAVTGTMEVAGRGQFQTFDKLMAAIAAGNTDKTTAGLWTQYLAAADQAFGKINGQPASQFIASSPQAQPLPPDGLYTGIEVYTPNFTADNAFYAVEYPVVNTQGSIDWWEMQRVNGVATVRGDGKLKYAVTDSTGKTVLSGYSDYSVTNGGSISTTSLADGGYPFTGCWIAPGAADCDLSGSTAFTTYFSVLRNYPNNWKNIMWFFGNNLSLVNTGDATTTTSLPGMLGVLLNGNRNDVLVTDGKQTLPFTPMFPDNPVFTDVPSLFIPWPASSATPKIAAMTNVADVTVQHIGAPVAPGEIVSIYGSGLAAGTASATTLPLPLTLAGTSVMVNGVPAPSYMASPNQINVQVPYGTSGSTANVVVTTPAGTATATVAAAASDPQIIRGPGGQTGTDVNYNWATTFSDGQNVSLWVIGLGATLPAVPEGTPAPTSPLAAVKGQLQVLLCGDILTSTNGILGAWLAPGWAGLYQINLQIPNGDCFGELNPLPAIVVGP